MHREIENGMGCAGLVPTAAERRQEKAEEARRARERTKDSRIAALELALNQIINGCVDDGDEALAYFKLSPGEIRNLARSALGKRAE